MEVGIIAILLTLITALVSIMVALLLYCLKTIDTRFNSADGRVNANTERINCIDRKVVKLGVLIGMTNPDKVTTHESPLKIRENETVTEVIERYMKDDGGGEKKDGKRGL